MLELGAAVIADGLLDFTKRLLIRRVCHHARGNVILVRYADDIVAGFEYQADAKRFQAELLDKMLLIGIKLERQSVSSRSFPPPEKFLQPRGPRAPERRNPATRLILKEICHGATAFLAGYLRLSLVTCPVAMLPATSEAEKVRFHTLNRATGNRVHACYVDAQTGKPVDDEDQVKGYEREDGVCHAGG